MEVSGQLHTTATLPLGENLRVGGWVGLRADLDILEKIKSFALTRNRTLDCPAHSLVTILAAGLG